MTRDDDIFADALDLPPAERAAFLDRACAGDPERRARVESLLAAHESARDFLERPLVPPPPLPPEAKAGDLIGKYELRRHLGEGGYGTVWLAEQRVPLRRYVALKILKLGMDTRSVIARFEAERQTLALMTHPDIAQVYDAGATDSGRPYFVMEYVDGVPITRYCDEHDLPLAARLQLFVRVCAAVQHAHQKGIIHRDLKPSNILVTEREGVPVAKVIDFGIAKATRGRDGGQTLLTEAGHIIGTPAYMSPEQAGLRERDVDTRSDVYALGVVLYELLTGRPPYDPKSLEQAGLLEIQRIIREVDPPRPSTVIGTLTREDRGTVARQRGAEVPQLTAVLRGDLDWIVMRCLEKDREHRYGTASELAEDIQRHLRHDPVLARPLQLRYRLQKFVARNRGLCASIAAITLILIGGTIVSVRQAVRATRAERVASAERDAANAARADAQRRQEQAEDLLAFMLGDFRTELKKIGRLELLDRVGAKAMDYFKALDPRDLTDTALARQAKALTQIGEVRMDQARFPEAMEALLVAQERAAALAARHPQNGDMLFERGQAEFWAGYVSRRRGDFAAEKEWFTRYRDTSLSLLTVEGRTERAQLEVIYAHHNLAVIEADRGSLAQAEKEFLAERAALDALLAVKPDDTQLRFNRGDVASWLGSVAEYSGRLAEARRYFEEMTDRYQALHGSQPTVARWKLELAQSLIFRGRLAAITGHPEVAATFYAEARPWFDGLVAQDPKNKQWLLSQQNLQLLQSGIKLAAGDSEAVAPVIAGVLRQLEELVAAEPTSLNFQRILAATCRHQGNLLLAQGKLAEADTAARRAREIGEKLLQDARADIPAFQEYAHANLLAGRIAQAQSQPDAAAEHGRRALAAIESRLPGSQDWRLLEAAALAYALSAQPEKGRPLALQLAQQGFQSSEPWARTVLARLISPPTTKP
jgi:serine/threonine-protein kinase